MRKDDENNLSFTEQMAGIMGELQRKNGESSAILEASNIVLKRTNDITCLLVGSPIFKEVTNILLEMNKEILSINIDKKEEIK